MAYHLSQLFQEVKNEVSVPPSLATSVTEALTAADTINSIEFPLPNIDTTSLEKAIEAQIYEFIEDSLLQWTLRRLEAYHGILLDSGVF